MIQHGEPPHVGAKLVRRLEVRDVADGRDERRRPDWAPDWEALDQRTVWMGGTGLLHLGQQLFSLRFQRSDLFQQPGLTKAHALGQGGRRWLLSPEPPGRRNDGRACTR